MLLTRICILAVLCLALAQPAVALTARAQLKAFVADVHTLKSDFSQTVRDRDGELIEASSGTLALAAPRQFRFEYREPYPQLLLADGDRLWVYDPELEQVTVRAQSNEEANSPLTLILEPDSLDQSFIVTEGGNEAALSWLLLTPKEERADFDRLELGFDQAGLAQMRYRDPTGQQTDLAFSGWARDSGLAANYFQFEPPPGVDVVGMEELNDAQVQPLQ